MSIIFEGIHSIYKKYANVDTLSKIMAVLTPIIIAKNQLIGYCQSFIPSYVERIVHFDTESGKISEKYIAWKNRYSLKNGIYELMGLSKDGYYMFVVWNNFKLCYQHYILQADLVEKALETKNVYNLWSFHDHAIVLMLSNFVSYSTIGAHRILGITVNNEDVTRKVKPFMKTISIPNNVRPNLMYMLTRYLSHEVVNMDTLTNSSSVYMNDNMDEVCVEEADRYLIKPILNCHPVYYSSDDIEELDNTRRVKAPSCHDEIEELYEKDKDI